MGMLIGHVSGGGGARWCVELCQRDFDIFLWK